jgi:hypothetical protein
VGIVQEREGERDIFHWDLNDNKRSEKVSNILIEVGRHPLSENAVIRGPEPAIGAGMGKRI